MIVMKQIFYEVGPKTKSRRKVVHDIKKVEKHCFKAWLAARGAWQRNLAPEEASSKTRVRIPWTRCINADV